MDTVEATKRSEIYWFHVFKSDVSTVRVEAFASLKGDRPLVDELMSAFGKCYAQAREKGEVDSSVDPLQAAAHIFALYCLGLVAWLNSVAPIRELVEAQLELLMNGTTRKGGSASASVETGRSSTPRWPYGDGTMTPIFASAPTAVLRKHELLVSKVRRRS